MKSGDVFFAKTHADLLNELLGTNYKCWMKATYNKYQPNCDIWMIRLSKHQTKFGWTNYEEGNKIVENYTGERSEMLDSHRSLDCATVRAIFEVVDGYQRRYIFKGYYQLDEKVSNIYYREWVKLPD